MVDEMKTVPQALNRASKFNSIVLLAVTFTATAVLLADEMK